MCADEELHAIGSARTATSTPWVHPARELSRPTLIRKRLPEALRAKRDVDEERRGG
jgi:hypothetical protein